MADLLINNLDAFATYGVRMGDNFLDALGAPSPMKPYIENESRVRNGKEVLTKNARIDSRQLTLEFTIQGKTPQDYMAKKQNFYRMLYAGGLTIKVPENSNEVYKLNYLGTSPIYSQSRNRCFGRVSLKFEESDPTDR